MTTKQLIIHILVIHTEP